jgi:beta-glucosidase
MMGKKRSLLAAVLFLSIVLPIEATKLFFRDEHYWRTNEQLENADTYPFQDPSLPWDKRVDDLVSRLTLEEIIPQTQAGYSGQPPSIPRLNIKPYVWITECLHGDSHTHGTAFPQSIGLAAAFSPDLVFNVAEATSYEVRAHWNKYSKEGQYQAFIGLSCFSPVINIMRHPLWGRNQETYGEDPYLAGKLVQGYVRGLQGNHSRYVRASAGCKHFDVHGGPENIPVRRESFDSKVSILDWRMTFLPQFKMCVEAGTYSLMCSFNSINGIPACVNQQLLTNITRNEWGFKGYVVSDAGAISNVIYEHKYLKTPEEAAAAGIKAGCNLELHLDNMIYSSTLNAMKAGLLTEKQIRDNVWPLMYTRMRLGEFDPVEMNPYNAINMSIVQSTSHRQLALQAAMKTFVLLKNDESLLPLQKVYNKLAVVGPFAQDYEQIYGEYSPEVSREFTTTVAEGLAKLAVKVEAASGCNSVPCDKYSAGEVEKAVDGADLVVVALGTGKIIETEATDRSNIDFPGKQLEVLLDAVRMANGKPVILLLFNAGPLDVTWAKWNPKVSVIMECFFPGETTGVALYQTLTATGGTNSVPAGRMPATWPSYLLQVPPITDYNMAGHTYRYYDGEPLYPFGYGLSYTTFLYTSLTTSPETITGGQNITATVGVLNTGKFDADEVIQLYVSWPSTDLKVPKIQLVAFARETFTAGDHKLVSLVITPERIAAWGDNGWTYVKGSMKLFAGGQRSYSALCLMAKH